METPASIALATITASSAATAFALALASSATATVTTAFAFAFAAAAAAIAAVALSAADDSELPLEEGVDAEKYGEPNDDAVCRGFRFSLRARGGKACRARCAGSHEEEAAARIQRFQGKSHVFSVLLVKAELQQQVVGEPWHVPARSIKEG